MPGSVSDSYDPEWGTGEKGAQITEAIEELYQRVTAILGGAEPVDIRKLVDQKDKRTRCLVAGMPEWHWRIIRFALERAKEAI